MTRSSPTFSRYGVPVELAFELHDSSVSSMASILLDAGYSELRCLLSDEDLDFSIKSFFDSPSEPVRDTVFSFFVTLFHGDPSGGDPAEVLLSHGFDIDGAQHYVPYVVDDVWEAESLVTALAQDDALVFPGTFTPLFADGEPLPNARLEQQRTWNALVIDVDPDFDLGEDEGLVKGAVDPGVLAGLLRSLPSPLLPTHVSLSGNGFHLWYIFEKPVPTGTTRNPRRRSFQQFIERFSRYVQSLLVGLPASVDMNCARLNHGFRAPGSKTKYGDLIRCFELSGRETCDPLRLSRLLSLYDGGAAGDAGLLDESDVEWLDPEEYRRSVADRMSEPASDKQMSYLYDLAELGYVEGGVQRLDDSNLTVGEAGELIRESRAKRGIPDLGGGRSFQMQPNWERQPHTLTAGSTGGVYQVIYNRITDVDVGKRYMALYMLAGVAYMMVDPKKPLAELRQDYMALLDTPWARAGKPITAAEVNKAVKGYCAANYRTRNSIERALGFSPFGEPQKRNGNSREYHLGTYVPQKRADALKSKALDKMCAVITDAPHASKAEVARKTGLSRPTVSKYWDEARSLIDVGSCDGELAAVSMLADAISFSPEASKSELARITGLSRPTVIKYYDLARSMA